MDNGGRSATPITGDDEGPGGDSGTQREPCRSGATAHIVRGGETSGDEGRKEKKERDLRAGPIPTG